MNSKVQGMGQKLSNTDVGGSENCGREAPTETKLSNFWQCLHKKQNSFVGGFQISWARYTYWQVFQTIPCPLPVDWKFFTRIFFFQLRVRAHGGVQLKICFSTIKDLPIWFFSNNGIFLSQNSYGYKMLWYSFRAIFRPKFTKFNLTFEIIIRNRSKVP